MVVNTLRNPSTHSTHSSAVRTPATHYIIPRGVVSYATCTNGVCVIFGLIAALGRTLVTVEYEEKRTSQCIAQDKMLLFHVEIIVIASSVAVLGQLKEEEEERRTILDPF